MVEPVNRLMLSMKILFYTVHHAECRNKLNNVTKYSIIQFKTRIGQL